MFAASAALPPDERSRFLDQACQGDAELREQIGVLLNSDVQITAFLERPGASAPRGRDPNSSPRLGVQPGDTVAGRFVVQSFLGAGGMGEVYRALDTRLGRIVALKVLPASSLQTADLRSSLIAEARAISALSHPNICSLYDLESDGELSFLVMECLIGETLAVRLQRGPLRGSELWRIAVELTDALAYAHHHRFVHRDLKPSNVMLTASGTKLLDFGLARRIGPTGGSLAAPAGQASAQTDVSESAIAGTVAYMSPEQALGKPLDARSDIFSFGVLLFEIVTGQKPFQGETNMSIISSILRDEPQPLSRFASNIPRDLEKIVNRCLQKDASRRYQNIADVRVALLELKEEAESSTSAAALRVQKRKRYEWIAGFLIVLGLCAAAGMLLWVPSQSPQTELRAVPFANYAGFQAYPAFSPDGKEIAFAWTGGHGAVTHIYVRMIGTDTPLQVTSGDRPDSQPAWAPDGRSIAFFRAESVSLSGLYKITPFGGDEKHIADLSTGSFPGLGWSQDGKLLVTSGHLRAAETRSRIDVISVESGEQRFLSFGDTGSEFSPALSPNPRLLAFTRILGDSEWGIFVVRVDGKLAPAGNPRRLNTPPGSNREAAWTPDGKTLLFASGGTDATRLWRIPVKDGSAQQLFTGGGVAYQPAIAPVGARLAYVHDFNDANIWSVSIDPSGKAGNPVQVISSARSCWVKPNAVSPDGKNIAFESNRSDIRAVWIANSDGSNPRLLFGESGVLSGSPTWSPDGRRIAFDTRKDKHAQLYVIPSDGGTARRLTRSSSDDLVPSWSHDGKWIYFDSNRTGRFEIFKIPSEGGGEVQVTRNGGWAPQESADGRFLYYTRARAVSTPLLKIPTDGGEEAEVLSSVRERWWALSDRGIWFMATSNMQREQDLWPMESSGSERGNLCFFSFAHGGAPAVVAPLKSPGGGMAISRDGRTLFFNQVDHRANEILLVENFH